jgi:hypothetical protein
MKLFITLVGSYVVFRGQLLLIPLHSVLQDNQTAS